MSISQQTASTPDVLGHQETGKRSFSLALYLLIVFVLSWPFLIASAFWASSLFWGYLLNSTGMLMVAVSTWLAGKFLFGEDFAAAGWSWGKPRHYLGVVALVGLLWLLPTLLDLVRGSLALPTAIGRGPLIWVVLLPFFTLIPGFGEEFGWRGYLLPRLAQRMDARQAVLVHATIWWVWHWPAIIGAAVRMSQLGSAGVALPSHLLAAIATVLLTSGLPTILHGLLFAWLWSRTQSLALVTVYHALYDAVRDALAITIGVGALAASWATVCICLLGVLLLRQGDWQLLPKQLTVTEQ